MAEETAIQKAMKTHQAGELASAERMYLDILGTEPGNADALHLLGVLYRQTRRMGEAAELIARAIGVNPRRAAFHHNLGNCLADLGRKQEAIEAYREALRLRPGTAVVHHALGLMLHQTGDARGAIEQYREAVRIDPAMGLGHAHLGAALAGEEQFAEAITEYRRALELNPGDEVTHWNLAMALLVTGDMEEGWKEFERRWDFLTDLKRPDLKGELWKPGEDLKGKRVLLHVEGGFGDAFNFVRYAPEVAKMGARVILECGGPIVKMFERVEGVERVIERGKDAVEYDRHCPFQGLPLRFGTRLQGCGASEPAHKRSRRDATLQNAGVPVPYLNAEERLVKQWALKLEEAGWGKGELSVGLCWAGNPGRLGNRSRELKLFGALGEVEGVRFVSLQTGPEAQQASPPGMHLLRVDLPISDFSYAAALIQNLDLVISIDSAIAHLAGTMGKRTWTLLARPCDFRWLLEREDSPWYPTMRLFRQETGGQWGAPVAKMREALRELAATKVGEIEGRW